MIPMLIWISGLAAGAAMSLAIVGKQKGWNIELKEGVAKLVGISILVGAAGLLMGGS